MPVKRYTIAAIAIVAGALALAQPGSAAAEEPGAEVNGKANQADGKATTSPRADETVNC